MGRTLMPPDRKRAANRDRVARWRKAQRDNRHDPVAYAYVSYNGRVLGKLIVKGYITEADTTDATKVNAALSTMLRDWAHE